MGDISNRVGDVGAYLREQREHARLSLRQLASVAGVSNPYLSQIERGVRKPSAEVLQQIAKGLQISAEALFMRAGILEESEGVQVEAAIHADVHLTTRQKRVLLDIYATFLAENARAADSSEPEPDSAPDRTDISDRAATAALSPRFSASKAPAKAPGARTRKTTEATKTTSVPKPQKS
jgi:transcriptional regulator with XRE-family HTH domain